MYELSLLVSWLEIVKVAAVIQQLVKWLTCLSDLVACPLPPLWIQVYLWKFSSVATDHQQYSYYLRMDLI